MGLKTFLTICLLACTTPAVWSQSNKLYDSSLFCSFGGVFHAPRTDYVSPCGGLNIGLEFVTTHGHAFIVDGVIGSGKACEDFKTSEGMILKHDRLQHYQVYLDYGRVVYQTSKVQLFPFVGLGGTGFSYEYDARNEVYFSKDAFSTCVGVSYDILLRSRFMDQKLCIKPYASVSFYNDPLHVVPSFNVAVVWKIGSYLR